MVATYNQRTGILLLLGIAVLFGANHVCARLAFDAGASVATVVSVRSACTALFLVLLLSLQGFALLPHPGLRLRALGVGLLVSLQSYCLYSAVKLIPVGIALLVFQTVPLIYVVLSAVTGRERIRSSALVAMPVALVGLVLALNLRPDDLSSTGRELGPGVAWAFSAALCFTTVMYANAYWVKDVDGRVRTLSAMTVAAVVLSIVGAASGGHALPQGAAGYAGLVLLTLFYGTAITSLFMLLPRLAGGAAATIALNTEPLAALALAWLVLGQAIAPIQMLGALVVVSAIVYMAVRR
jgi:drug/metabolite transporter (DMT)-like permease